MHWRLALVVVVVSASSLGAQTRTPVASTSSTAFELGARVTPSRASSATGVRFWKVDAADVGPHIGRLWSTAGALLASAPFVNETASGWQAASFAAPVAVQAGVALVVSVNGTPGAHYALEANALARVRTIGDLTTPAIAGRYGSVSVAPTLASPHDYFRDLVLGPNTGGLTVSSRLLWETSDAVDVDVAQAYGAHVRVDAALLPITLVGVTCTATPWTDATGAIWTLGAGVAPDLPVLRNGVVSGHGSRIVLAAGTVFVETALWGWYRWLDRDWAYLLATDPSPATLDATRPSRWTCQAPLPAALVLALNVRGTHAIVLSLSVPNESPGSSPATWVAP